MITTLVHLLSAIVCFFMAGALYRNYLVLEWMATDEFKRGNYTHRPAFVKMKEIHVHDHVQRTTEGFLHAHCSWSFPWTWTCYFHNPGGNGPN